MKFEDLKIGDKIWVSFKNKPCLIIKELEEYVAENLYFKCYNDSDGIDYYVHRSEIIKKIIRPGYFNEL